MVFTPTTTGNQAVHIYPLNSDVHAWWGAQLEAGAFPTSYIATTSAAVTRTADSLNIPTGGWYNSTEGTTFANADTGNITSGSQPAIFSFDDATINNRIQLRRNNSTNKLTHVLVSAGTTISVAGGSTTWADTNQHKITFGYKSALNQSYFDGVAQTNYLTSSLMPSVTQLEIGMGTNATNINGHIGQIKYYPSRINNTQLQLLTQYIP